MSILPVSPMLAFQSAWTPGAAFICIGVLALIALIRSHTTRGEGAH